MPKVRLVLNLKLIARYLKGNHRHWHVELTDECHNLRREPLVENEIRFLYYLL